MEADVRSTIAESYYALGLYTEAQPQYERAWALRRARLGDRHRETLDSMTSLAVIFSRVLKKALHDRSCESRLR